MKKHTIFGHTRSVIKDFFIFIWQKLFLHKPLSILMYHSVSDSNHFFSVRPEAFVWQMEYLHTHGYTVLSLSDVIFLVENKKPLPQKSVVLTFDDGYSDNYSIVFPIIKKYNFPITIFLSTGLVGQLRTFKNGDSLPIMSVEEIRDMHESGLVTFEPHGHMHQKLIHMGMTAAEQEIMDSKKYIEDMLGWPTSVYAYTWGKYTDTVLSIVGRSYRYAMCVKRGFCCVSDFEKKALYLPRHSVDSSVTKFRFKLKV